MLYIYYLPPQFLLEIIVKQKRLTKKILGINILLTGGDLLTIEERLYLMKQPKRKTTIKDIVGRNIRDQELDGANGLVLLLCLKTRRGVIKAKGTIKMSRDGFLHFLVKDGSPEYGIGWIERQKYLSYGEGTKVVKAL